MTLLLAHGDGDVFGPFSGWAFLLRFGQYLLQTAPGLLTGVLLAGLLRTRAGRGWLLACLDGAPTRSMLRAAIIGLVAPVGALGALPIASEMLRARVRPSAILCFLVTAPLFMPWTFGHAADRLGLLNACLVLLGSVLLAFVTGLSARAWGCTTQAAPPADAVGPRSQLLVALRAAARLSAGWLWVYVLVAIGSAAALAAVLQPGAIEAHLGEQSIGTLFELAVPIALANIEADLAVVFAGEFWRIGLLTGGVSLAFQLGAAWSLGTLGWCLHRLGRTGAIASIVWLVAALGIAMAGNGVISPARPGEADSHAFDPLTKPYNFGGASPAEGVVQQLRRAADGQAIALAALFILTIAGALDRLRVSRASATSRASTSTAHSPRYSQFAVRATLSSAAAVCLLASVYSYFPPPDELRDRLRLESGNLTEAAATLENPQRTPDERSAAQLRALNALDRIDDALGRYPVSRAIRFADSSNSALDVTRARRASRRVEELILERAFDPLRTATLDLAEQIARSGE
jgi:hypothetical protein